jgi:hypothetical protein
MILAQDVPVLSPGAVTAYKAAAAGTGVLLLAIAGFGLGSSIAARVVSGAFGVGFLAYFVRMQFLLPPGEAFGVYPVVFVLPLLVIGYVFYSRAIIREDEAAAAREEAEQEKPS